MSRIKNQFLADHRSSLNASVELMDKDARSYFFRIMAMLKERETSRLKLPANDPSQISPLDLSVQSDVEEKSPVKKVHFLGSLTQSADEEQEEIEKNLFSRRKVSGAMHLHEKLYKMWSSNLSLIHSLHKGFSKELDRGVQFTQDCSSFENAFDSVTSKAFTYVFCGSCVLEIRPMKVENITSKNSVHVKISYGDKVGVILALIRSKTHPLILLQVFRTKSIPSSHYMTWTNEEYEENEVQQHPSGNEIENSEASDSWAEMSSTASFDVDMLNIKGNIKIRLIAESFPSFHELGFVEIPISGIVDSTCTLSDASWFSNNFLLSMRESSSLKQNSLVRSGNIDQLVYQLREKNSPKMLLSMRLLNRKDVHSLEERKFYNRFQIPSFSFSCIDSDHARDVMLVTVQSMEIKISSARDSTNLSVIVSNLQVDNQLSEAACPVILFPTPVKNPQPVLRMHFKKKNLLSQSNLDCYETAQFVIQQLDLKVEQQTVLASWEMIKTWNKEISDEFLGVLSPSGNALSAENPNWNLNLENFDGRIASQRYIEPSVKNNINTFIDDENVEKIYIDDFKIFPIQINVSFIINPSYIIRKYRKEQRENISDEASAGFYSALSIFLWQIGTVALDLTSSISNAPIFFNGFEAPHLFKTSNDVARILQEHYLHSALGQLYKIVFSSDVVGNPIALLNSLSVGVHDFFYEPAYALITTPTEFRKIGKGFMKGTASLVSNAAVGFIGTSTTITRSIGRGVLKLSMDETFIKAREKLQQNPKTVMETMARPIKDIGNGIYHGVTGLMTVPYRSVRKKGFRGFLPGVAKGVIGLGAVSYIEPFPLSF
jgi:hypothetical protein